MPELTFSQELLKVAVGGAVPTLALILGGRWLLDKYDIRKMRREQELEFTQKRREQELELVRFVRQRQYEALQELYSLFAEYMAFYRLINSGQIDLREQAVRTKLLEPIAIAEGRVDAAILRIASEFTHSDSPHLTEYLSSLRQSVQIWRERVREGQDLPFYSSGQQDYARFKTSFVRTCTYLASLIYGRLEPSAVAVEQATSVLTEVFDNRHEWHGPHV